MAQRRGFREYLAGLLAPRDRNKTLTALAGAEPVTGSKLPAVQRLQFFLSESVWDPERVNDRRLDLLRADPATAPHGGGVLIIDDSGDRKDGTATAHVGRQYLGRYGKTDNGVVTVTTVWADERVYYPVHAVPYTPAKYFAKGKNDPEFRTKLQIGADLAVRAREAGFCFRAVVADSAYGDQDGFRAGLAEAGLPFVMALRPHRGTWARAADAHTPVEAARALAWGGPGDPGDWHPVTRTFRDGHAETWWAADASLGGWGPDGVRRLVVATADPGTLPDKATWYLVTNLARPGGPREKDSPWPGCQPGRDRAPVRHPALDRAELQAGQGRAGLGRLPGPLRPRHPPPPDAGQLRVLILLGRLVRRTARPHRMHAAPQPGPGGGERGRRTAAPPAPSWPRALRAIRAWLAPWIALQRWWTGMVQGASAPAAASPDQLGRGRPRPAPLHPELTDYH